MKKHNNFFKYLGLGVICAGLLFRFGLSAYAENRQSSQEPNSPLLNKDQVILGSEDPDDPAVKAAKAIQAKTVTVTVPGATQKKKKRPLTPRELSELYPIHDEGAPRQRVGDPNLGYSYEDLPDREGVKMGNLRVHAAVKGQSQYDSNIYLTKNGRDADVIFMETPSVAATLPMGDSHASAEYAATFNQFSIHSKNNHIDQRAMATGEINLTDYKIRLGDVYRRFKDRYGSEDVNRLKRQLNTAVAGIQTKEWNRLFFDLGYTNKLDSYLTTEPLSNGLTYRDKSYMEHIIGLASNYRAGSKTYITWDNDFGMIRYLNSSLPPDSVYVESLLGVRGELTSKIDANIKAGCKYAHYKKSDIFADKDWLNWIARGGLDYSPTEDDKISLDIGRDIYESTFSNMNYYSATSLGLNYAHKMRKVTGSLFGSIQQDGYPTKTTMDGVSKKRSDWDMGGGCSLRYDMRKWISMQLRYEFKARHSNFSSLSYTDNLVTASVAAGF